MVGRLVKKRADFISTPSIYIPYASSTAAPTTHASSDVVQRPKTEVPLILNNKSNFFWEDLAQQLAQRVLYGGAAPTLQPTTAAASASLVEEEERERDGAGGGAGGGRSNGEGDSGRSGRMGGGSGGGGGGGYGRGRAKASSPASTALPIDMFGPQCTTPSGSLTCDIPAAAHAARISIRTTVDAPRDDLMPVTRQIYLSVSKTPFDVYDVTYAVSVSAGVTVASPFHEHLDIRPHVGGAKLNTTVTLLADSPATRTFYPDYNLLFIPLRHLAFQGNVTNPREPGSSINYSSLDELQNKVMTVVGMMRQSSTAAMVAKLLEPFFAPKFYYMFDYFNFTANNISGVQGYKEQTIGPGGLITSGFAGSIEAVEIHFGRSQ